MQWIVLHAGDSGPSLEVTVEAETSQEAIDGVRAILPEGRKICHVRRRNYPGLPDERPDVPPEQIL